MTIRKMGATLNLNLSSIQMLVSSTDMEFITIKTLEFAPPFIIYRKLMAKATRVKTKANSVNLLTDSVC
jgi:hypothetical protein